MLSRGSVAASAFGLGRCSARKLFVFCLSWPLTGDVGFNIYVFCLFCVVLAESVWQDVEVMKAPLVLVLLYATTWSVPHCCSYQFGGGVIGEAYEHLAR